MRGSNDPFDRMEEMFEQMRRSAYGPRADWTGQGRPARGDIGRGRPVLPEERTRDAGVTLEERDEGFVVLADLPGFEPEEIDLTYDDGVLTIEGAHEVTDDDEYRQRTISEWVRIPGDVVVDDVSATYRNGVLEVTLPADDEASDEHRIDIE